MRVSSHPLWLAGFRPFFSLVCLSGMALPVLWALVFSGKLTLPASPINIIQWHAHEMFFGFGWAVMGGFLLTSTKNWVGVRGYHGLPLILLVIAWLLERIFLWYAGSLPPLLFRLGSQIFLASITVMLLLTLFRHRQTDSYRSDNVFFLILLPVFLLAKNLLLGETTFAAGQHMTLGLFRLAFLVMLERTLTQFMQSAYQVAILRHAQLDRTIKSLALLYVAAYWMPPALASGIALLLAALLLLRFGFWSPHLAMRRIDIGIMYLGYLALTAQLVLDAASLLALTHWVGSVSMHVFTFGVMGWIIPAMLIRICKGHTGRKVGFDRIDRGILWVMIAGFGFRIIAPQLDPAHYLRWIEIAASAWFVTFAILAWRYIPFLLQPRADGREH